ncbi:MAG: DUF2619 domain-containing protein [Firmicutes bacterium]|nr:DUF2619 domain-containing protein [Bacillota bacterium]
MAMIRVVSAAIELSAALLMLRLARLEPAVQINAALGLVGPLILVTVTLLGLAGLAGQIPVARLLLVTGGVVLIVLGARR